MFIKIIKTSLFIHIMIASFAELIAKPVEESIVSKNKCDDLIWTRVNAEEWSVKKRVLNESTEDGIKVWWPSLGKCVDLTEEINYDICNNRGSPVLNSRMEGSCYCYSNFAAIAGKEGCHRYYDQGPCIKGQIVTFDDMMTKAVCSKDLCAKENENVTKFYKRYVPINETCYILDSSEPCANLEQVLIVSKVPMCSQSLIKKQSFTVFPRTCKVSAKDYICRLDISIDAEDDETKHINQLIEDLQK